MTKHSVLILRLMSFLLPLCLASPSFASPGIVKSLKIESGEIKFIAIGKPGFLKINGHSNQKPPEGEIQVTKEGLTAKLAIAIAHFDTGIDLRNEHMKEKYLDVQKYPNAELNVTMAQFKDANLSQKYDGDFAGMLLLHGETRPVQGKLSFEPATKIAKASFSFKVSDFKIDIPKYMGITVSESVDVTVELKLRELN